MIDIDRIPIPILRTMIALVKAAGGTQRVSTQTIFSLHTDDELSVNVDPETGDYVFRATRRSAPPQPGDA